MVLNADGVDTRCILCITGVGPSRRRMFAACLAVVSLAMTIACQSKSSVPVSNEPAHAIEAAANAPNEIDAVQSDDGMKSAFDTKPQSKEPIGAIPAWDAVIWRNRYLARRNQQAIVVGVVGDRFTAPSAEPIGTTIVAPVPQLPTAAPTPAAIDNLTWLIDESTGHGSLGIRVRFAGNEPSKGARVAVTGAWAVNADLTWYWQAASLQELDPALPSDINEPMASPGFVIATGAAPVATRPVSQAKDNDVVRFSIVAAPFNPGDGWLVADELGDPPVAILYLPGDQASYGGLDMRGASERWQLKRGVSYWVRIGRIRRPKPTGVWLANARTAPVRDL